MTSRVLPRERNVASFLIVSPALALNRLGLAICDLYVTLLIFVEVRSKKCLIFYCHSHALESHDTGTRLTGSRHLRWLYTTSYLRVTAIGTEITTGLKLQLAEGSLTHRSHFDCTRSLPILRHLVLLLVLELHAPMSVSFT